MKPLSRPGRTLAGEIWDRLLELSGGLLVELVSRM